MGKEVNTIHLRLWLLLLVLSAELLLLLDTAVSQGRLRYFQYQRPRQQTGSLGGHQTCYQRLLTPWLRCSTAIETRPVLVRQLAVPPPHRDADSVAD